MENGTPTDEKQQTNSPVAQKANGSLEAQENTRSAVEPGMTMTNILPDTQAKKSKKKLIIIATIVVVLIVAGLGFAGYKIYENNKNDSNSNNDKTLFSVIDVNGNKSYIPKEKFIYEANDILYEISIDGTEATILVNKLQTLSQPGESSILSNNGKYIAYSKYSAENGKPKLNIHIFDIDTGNNVIADTLYGATDIAYNHFYGWAGDKLVYWDTDRYESIKVFDTSNNTTSVILQNENNYEFSELFGDVYVLDDTILFMQGCRLSYVKLDGSNPVFVKDFSQDFVNKSPNVQLMLMRTGINNFNIGIYDNDAGKLDKYYTYSVGGTVSKGTDNAVMSNFIGTFIYDYASASQINIPQSPDGKLAWLDASKWQIMIGNSDGSNAQPLAIQTDSSEVFYPYKYIDDDYLIIKTSSDNENNFYVISVMGGIPTKLNIDIADVTSSGYMDIREWGVKIATGDQYMGYRWDITNGSDLVSVFITDDTNGLSQSTGCSKGDIQGVYVFRDHEYSEYNNDNDVMPEANLNVGEHTYYLYKMVCNGDVSSNVDSLADKVETMILQ